MKTPPNLPLKFLRWFCREDYLEEIEGDLTELFKKNHEHSKKLTIDKKQLTKLPLSIAYC